MALTNIFEKRINVMTAKCLVILIIINCKFIPSWGEHIVNSTVAILNSISVHVSEDDSISDDVVKCLVR